MRPIVQERIRKQQANLVMDICHCLGLDARMVFACVNTYLDSSSISDYQSTHSYKLLMVMKCFSFLKSLQA